MRNVISALIATTFMTGVIFAVVGAGLALGGRLAENDLAPPDGGVETEAVIVDSVESFALINGVNTPRYAPIYEFTDLDGQLHRVTGIATESRRPAPGSIVEVSYIPGDPASVRRVDVDTTWIGWMTAGGTATGAFGAAAALAAGLSAVVRTARSRRTDETRAPRLA